MSKDGQRELIESLCDTLKEQMLKHLNSIPDNWDGIELRRYLVYKAKDFEIGNFEGKRKRDYLNTLITTTL